MRIGSHLSVAGGMHRALEAAEAYGFSTCALFVHGTTRWTLPPLSDAAVAAFRRTKRRTGVRPIVAHAPYLVNLAGEEPVRTRSLRCMIECLRRCGALSIEYLVLHPGSSPEEDAGVAKIAAGLDEAFAEADVRRPKVLLETTAGSGNSIGCRFEQLAAIFRASRRRRRLGVCLDTCHTFAAGWDFRTRAGYRRMMRRLDALVGLDRLLAVHANDSKRPCGSRVDRHEHIGRGRVGLEGFGHFLRDRRLSEVPMILETPKGKDDAGRDWDAINAETLRGLRKTRRGKGSEQRSRSSAPGRRAGKPAVSWQIPCKVQDLAPDAA